MLFIKKDEYENYRGITVLNIFSRLHGKIMKYFFGTGILPVRNGRTSRI